MAPERAVDDRSPDMTLARTVAEVLRDHVTLEVESVDRIYLHGVHQQACAHGGSSLRLMADWRTIPACVVQT